MRELSSSLPLAHLSAALNLPQSAIDALIEEGRVLCRVQQGEVLVPLAELEAVFREALMSLYAAEARGHAGLPLAARVEERVPLHAVSTPEPHAQEMSEARAPEDEDVRAAAAARQAEVGQGADHEASSDVEPFRLVDAGPRLAQAIEEEKPDQRRAARFVPLRQISGIFAEAKFTILQLSSTGLRIRHTEPLLPGDEAKLTFALLRTARSVVVRARVVWTSVGRIGEEQFSISGLRVIEHGERLEQAIEAMKAAHELQPERRSTARRAEDAVAMLREVSDEEMALVTAALHKFAADPVEASRWYSRGRFALADENVRRIAPQRGREREEVLGVWEYLSRQVDLEKVAGVMKWVRG